ncbi:Serine/threonine/tyrosine-interacting-like protein 1 [Aphanomyces cochlioides]|nr:Serine/threonine/tyrosine-interacting-like protein 1 [Aphanomyces cochlioides]
MAQTSATNSSSPGLKTIPNANGTVFGDQSAQVAFNPDAPALVATPADVFNFLQHSASNALVLDISSSFEDLPPMVLPVTFSKDGVCQFPELVTKRLANSALTHVFLTEYIKMPDTKVRRAKVARTIGDVRGKGSPLDVQFVDVALISLFPLQEPPEVNLVESSRGWIFLGNSSHAKNVKVVQTLEVECIVNCASSSQEKLLQDVEYFDLKVPKENVEAGAAIAFDEAVDFMVQAFKQYRRIMVHSTYGRSRCCTLVVYFIMKIENVSLVEAYHRVLKCRPQMMPRDAILDLLVQKEKSLYGKSSFNEADKSAFREKLKQLCRGDLLSQGDKEKHNWALANINSSEVKQLAAKYQQSSRESPFTNDKASKTTGSEALTSTNTKRRSVPESIVTCRWLFNRLQSGTGMLLIDSRSRCDFEDDCIPTAISIPSLKQACTMADVENALLPEQAHLFSIKKRKLREVVIYGDAVKSVAVQDNFSKGKPWMYVLGGLLVEEGLVTSVRYLEDGFTTFQFRYPFYTTLFLFDCQNNEDDHGNFLARTQSGTHNVNYPNEILDGFLFLGNMWHAQSPSVIRNLGITHIVNASLDTDNVFDEAGVIYHEVKIKDDVNADIAAHFESTYSFIENAKKVQHSRVLIHCTQGISRSCTLAIYYVMRAQRWSLVTSVNYCISNRGVCFPNQGFLQALMVEERKLYHANSLSTHELDLLVGNSLSDRPVPKPAPLEPYLQKPENCHVCNRLFSFFDWRHRCGICKVIVCGKCSSSRLILTEQASGYDKNDVGRVCDPCVTHLWAMHLPLPFRLAFNIFSDKYGMRVRRSLAVKSPSLQHQYLTVSYIPGTEAHILMNLLRKRFQVRDYELLDVTGDGVGLDSAWSLQSGGYLDLPDQAVLFASIGESGSIPVPRGASLRGAFTSTTGSSYRNGIMRQEQSFSSRSLPSNSRHLTRRSRSFSEGRALALQQSLRERERQKKRDQVYHHSLPGTRDGQPRNESRSRSKNSSIEGQRGMQSPSMMDDIRFAELWGAAYPYCSLIPRDQLLCLDKETMMELMLAISYLSSRVGHYTKNVDSNARQNVFSEVFETMKMSETTRQIMLQYIEINPTNR